MPSLQHRLTAWWCPESVHLQPAWRVWLPAAGQTLSRHVGRLGGRHLPFVSVTRCCSTRELNMAYAPTVAASGRGWWSDYTPGGYRTWDGTPSRLPTAAGCLQASNQNTSISCTATAYESCPV